MASKAFDPSDEGAEAASLPGEALTGAAGEAVGAAVGAAGAAIGKAASVAKDKAKKALKEGAKKLLKKVGLSFILQGAPIIGGFIPGSSLLVYKELGILGGVSPEGIIMYPIALIFDGTKIIITIVELCLGYADGTIISTLMGWLSWLFFGFWIWIRHAFGFKSKSDIKSDIKKTNREVNTKGEAPKSKNQKQSTPKIPKSAPARKAA